MTALSADLVQMTVADTPAAHSPAPSTTPTSTQEAPASPVILSTSELSSIRSLPLAVRANPHPTFLSASLLKIFARAIGTHRVPLEFHLAAEALARGLPGSHLPLWRVEVQDKTRLWPKIGKRLTVRFIVWTAEVDGIESRWAGEIMVDLRVVDAEDGKAERGKMETVAWRFGPRLDADDESAEGGGEEWCDWRTFNFEQYLAIEVEQEGGKVGGGTERLAIIELKEGKSMMLESVVRLVFGAVKKALGKPYQPDREELTRLMGRVEKTLVGEGKDVGRLVVTRGFRQVRTSGKFIPAAFVEVHCRRAGGGSEHAIGGKAAAVLMIDVWPSGAMKLMSVMYAAEEPVVHYYRTRFPPPETTNIRRAGETKSVARV